MGEEPSWYGLLQAAKYLGVAPWDLAQRPVWWTEIALAARGAESYARAQQQKRKAKPNAHGG